MKRKYFECDNVYCRAKVYEDHRKEGNYYFCLHCDLEHHEKEVKWKEEEMK